MFVCNAFAIRELFSELNSTIAQKSPSFIPSHSIWSNEEIKSIHVNGNQTCNFLTLGYHTIFCTNKVKKREHIYSLGFWYIFSIFFIFNICLRVPFPTFNSFWCESFVFYIHELGQMEMATQRWSGHDNQILH